MESSDEIFIVHSVQEKPVSNTFKLSCLVRGREKTRAICVRMGGEPRVIDATLWGNPVQLLEILEWSRQTDDWADWKDQSNQMTYVVTHGDDIHGGTFLAGVYCQRLYATARADEFTPSAVYQFKMRGSLAMNRRVPTPLDIESDWRGNGF